MEAGEEAKIVLGLLAEPHRLRVLSALVLGASSTAEVARATDLRPQEVRRALGKLIGGGGVRHGPEGYVVAFEKLRQPVRDSGGPSAASPNDSSRGATTREREVNSILRSCHQDFAALRRYLVDEGFLDQERGEYWLAGGTFALD